MAASNVTMAIINQECIVINARLLVKSVPALHLVQNVKTVGMEQPAKVNAESNVLPVKDFLNVPRVFLEDMVLFASFIVI